MRRKSTRNTQKATPDKPAKEKESIPKTRRSRRRKRSPSKSSESEDEVLTVTKRAPLEETPDTTTKSHTPSDEENSEEPVWKVTSTEGSPPKGEIQKLKICLTRPSPDSPEKNKTRRSKSNSQTEDDTTSSEDKSTRRTRSRGSPYVKNDGISSQEGDEDVEEKKGKGKSKGKHKSKIEKSPHVSEPEQQTNNEISENVQVTPQSPSIDKPVDNENDCKVDVDDIQNVNENVQRHENVDEEPANNVVRDSDTSQDITDTKREVEASRDSDDDQPLSIIQKSKTDNKKAKETEIETSESQDEAPKENIEVASKEKEEETISKEKEDEVVPKQKDHEIVSKDKEDEAVSKQKEDEVVSKETEDEVVSKEKKDEVASKETEDEVASKETEDEVASKETEDEVVPKQTEDEVSKENDGEATSNEDQNKTVLKENQNEPVLEEQQDKLSEDQKSSEESQEEIVKQSDLQDQDLNVESQKKEISLEEEKQQTTESSSKEADLEETKDESMDESTLSISVTDTTMNQEEDTSTEDSNVNKSSDTSNVNLSSRKTTQESNSPKVDVDDKKKEAVQSVRERAPRRKLKRNLSIQADSKAKEDTDEASSIKPSRVKRKWEDDSNFRSTLIKLDLESIQTVWPTIDFPEEPDLHLEIEKERRKSLGESKKLERKVSVEYKSDHSDRPPFEKQTSVNSVTKDSEDDNSNIIAFNRKISIVDDTASKLKPPPSPAKHAVSNILFITNLVRPFTVKQLKELLERTGKIQEEGFWTDRIKSKCYVQYETQEEAEATRNALHGVQWPIGNGKKLIIDYATEEDMQNAKNPPVPPAAAPAAPVPEQKVAVKENLEPVENKPRSEEKAPKELEKKKPEGPVREWDIGKKDLRRERSRSRERSRKHRRSPTPPEDFITKKQRKAEESVPQKLMDDLFLKTKATPSIYWQPLSPEEISMKQQQRLIRMEEHKRRMEENSRMKGREVGRGAFRRRYD